MTRVPPTPGHPGTERHTMQMRGSTHARRALAAVAAALALGLGTAFAAPAALADDAPSVTLSQATFDADGTTTITVTGSGFDSPDAIGLYPPLAGRPSGVYLAFGKFAPTWRPSQGASSSARPAVPATAGGLKWAVPADSVQTVGGASAGAIELAPDGTFTATLTISKAAADAAATAKGLTEGSYGIYTYPGGGASVPSYETYTPVTFTSAPPDEPDPDPTPTTGVPAVTIAERTVHDDGTLDLTVAGTGFDAALAGAGIYVAVGPKIGDDWYLNASRFQTTKWVHAGVPAESASQAALAADGTFTVHFTGVAPTFTGGGVSYDQATTPFLVLTMAAHGSPDRSLDTATPVSFAADGPGDGPTTTPTAPPTTEPATPTPAPAAVSGGSGDDTFAPGASLTFTAGGFGPGETGIRLELHSDPVVLASGLTADAAGVVTVAATIPAATAAGSHTLVLVGASRVVEYPITVAAPVPACVARSVAGATLTWGVRDSFRSYVTGPIATGAISASGVSGSGPWTWSGGSGRFNVVAGIGSASWSGGVHFTGHAGALDLTFSAPRITVTSSSAATLSMLVATPAGSSRVALATLNLAAGGHSASATRVAWSGVPATLTAAGADAFEGFYQTGAALDPVTFALPLGAEVDCDPSTGALPATGSDSGGLAALAAALVVTGAGLVLAASRRRTVRALA